VNRKRPTSSIFDRAGRDDVDNNVDNGCDDSNDDKENDCDDDGDNDNYTDNDDVNYTDNDDGDADNIDNDDENDIENSDEENVDDDDDNDEKTNFPKMFFFAKKTVQFLKCFSRQFCFALVPIVQFSLLLGQKNDQGTEKTSYLNLRAI